MRRSEEQRITLRQAYLSREMVRKPQPMDLTLRFGMMGNLSESSSNIPALCLAKDVSIRSSRLRMVRSNHSSFVSKRPIRCKHCQVSNPVLSLRRSSPSYRMVWESMMNYARTSGQIPKLDHISSLGLRRMESQSSESKDRSGIIRKLEKGKSDLGSFRTQERMWILRNGYGERPFRIHQYSHLHLRPHSHSRPLPYPCQISRRYITPSQVCSPSQHSHLPYSQYPIYIIISSSNSPSTQSLTP